MKRRIVIIVLILSFIMLIPASSYASIVAFSQTDEYGIPIGATGLVLEGDNAVDANQDYVNFDSYLDESCEANGTCFKGGVGIRLQVIKYEGGSEIAIGNPLYIINDALLDDIVLTNGVAIPGSYDSFASRNWGFTQHIAPEINFTDNWIVDDNPSGGEEGNPNLRQATYEMEGPDHTPLEGQTLEFPGQFSYQYDMSHCKGLPSGKGLASKSDAPIGHKTDYVHYIYRYSTGYKKTKYPKDKIKGRPSSYINDPNLTESSIAAGYLNTNIEKKYINISINKINEYYGTSLTDQDIGKYYIEMQGMYRHLLPPVYVGSFLVKTLSNIYEPENELESKEVKSYTPTLESECQSGDWYGDKIKDAQDAYCSRNNSYPTVPLTCSVSGTSCNNTVLCDYHAAQAAQYGDAYCHSKSWKYNSEACGKKNYHQLYGSYYEGESELLLTKSDRDESCNNEGVSTYTISNLITEEKNRHCKINDSDQQYSRKEDDNTCTTEYEYYIGPNQEAALVGTLSTSKYNLFGTVYSSGTTGNKCRSGVKHYFLLDSITDECTDICTGSNTTDSFLKCAENFCEQDVDYSLGGNPYLRKKDCVLHSCGYRYGMDPQTKEVNSKYAQSSSSCDNSSLYKDGTSYKKDSVNTTTSCSMNGSNYIDNVASHVSVCYGDTVTDYDKSDGNDTRFDERTYINIACEEVDKVTSITDVSRKIYKPGEPIDYALKVRGTIECTVFFDFEQWKVDFASIPRKDTIRKNRMKYLYDKFNNLLEVNYSTAEAYTRFEAKDYSGKNTYNWNMELTNYGTVSWDNYSYSSGNIKANVVVNEYQLNNSINKTKENPLSLESSLYTDTRNPLDLHATGRTYIYNGLKNRQLYSVENYNDVVMGTSANSELQAYKITSGSDLSFQFNKYCVDNTAKVIKKAEGGTCSNGTTGDNRYFVSFKAKASKDLASNKSHNFQTKVTMNSSLPVEQMYTDRTCTTSEARPETVTYNVTDTCNYNVKRKGTDDVYSCEVECTSGTPIGKGNYLNSFYAVLRTYKNGVKYTASNRKTTITSRYRSFSSTTTKTEVKLSSNNPTAIEKFTIKGQFTDPDNIVHTCDKTCSIITEIPSYPSCEIKQISTTLYEVIPYGNITRVGAFILKDTLDEESIVDIKANRQGKYYIEVKENSYATSIKITGEVEGPGGKNTCPFSDGITTEDYSCPELYKPGEYEQIKDYCDSRFLQDVNNYADAGDCMDKCIPCPEGYEPYEDTEIKINKNIEVIKKDYCMKWSENKYKSYESCVNVTYRLCVTGPDKGKENYIYRPVNVNNPFPSTVEAPAGYATGDRSIGVNWQGLTHYINETYVNKSAPDFSIVLDTSTINLIRSKVDSLEAAGETNVYSKEIYMNEADPTKKYLSSFIHEDLSGKFCYLNGVKQSQNCN